jgi:thymidylate kinase
MKLILIEGVDQCGKNTLIEGLCKHFNYDNVTIRHFSKPPKGLTTREAVDFQFKCFTNEAELVHQIKQKFLYTRYHYYDDVIIWNRSHLGEFVHGQLFRNEDPKEIKDKLLFFENFYFYVHEQNIIDTYLITMIADPEFLLSKEDGNSFSKDLEQKTKELELFKEAHNFSLIKKKIMIKVDKNEKFRSKEIILRETLTFLNL